MSVVLEQRKEEEARRAEEAEATSAAQAEASTDQNAIDTIDGAIPTEPLKVTSILSTIPYLARYIADSSRIAKCDEKSLKCGHMHHRKTCLVTITFRSFK